VQDRCIVCAECTMGMEIILGTLDGTPRLRGSSGSSFRSVCRECSSQHKIDDGLLRMYHGHEKHFGHTRWYSKVTCVKWKHVKVCLEIVLI
jgi:hypothetical protein